MAKKCVVTGKTPLTGYSVSHSKVHTKKRQNPNLQRKRLLNPASGKMETIMVSTRGLRTLAKWLKEGVKYNLRDLK